MWIENVVGPRNAAKISVSAFRWKRTVYRCWLVFFCCCWLPPSPLHFLFISATLVFRTSSLQVKMCFRNDNCSEVSGILCHCISGPGLFIWGCPKEGIRKKWTSSCLVHLRGLQEMSISSGSPLQTTIWKIPWLDVELQAIAEIKQKLLRHVGKRMLCWGLGDTFFCWIYPRIYGKNTLSLYHHV